MFKNKLKKIEECLPNHFFLSYIFKMNLRNARFIQNKCIFLFIPTYEKKKKPFDKG